MNSQTDIIKDKLNILDIVGEYVKLEKSGKNYKGKSPFTNEKTPSFFVSPEKGFFYCFSSGKGGDIFTFIQEIERVEFPEALKILADKAGIKLESSHLNKKEQSEREKLFKLLEVASRWYEVNLRKNKEVVTYLLNRGLTKETIIKFRIGFSLDSWNSLYNYLKSKKFSDKEIERAGLSINKEGSGYYDRFRSRIMFPLFDSRGRIVGFSGRIFGNDDNIAKYINSPEGPLFNKSNILYGYNFAKHSISKAGYCILVEGQFDVILSQQSGYENTVAISGTGLTDGHIKLIKRFTDNIYLAFDSDSAGIKATRRSALLGYKNNLIIKIILLEKGKDPADIILNSKESWDVALLDPKDYIDYRISILETENPSFEEKHKFVYNDLFELIYFTKSSISQDYFLQKVSLFLGVPIENIRKEFEGYKPQTVFSDKSNIDFNKKNRLINNEQDNLKKELLFLINYTKETFSEEYLLIKNNIDSRYMELFSEDILEGLGTLSEEEIAMSFFVADEKMSGKKFKYFENNIFSLLNSMLKDKLENELFYIQKEIRKEQLLNPSKIPKELMNKSSDILKKIDSMKNTL